MNENPATTDIVRRKAILIGVSTRHETDAQTIEYLEELEFLTRSAGAEVAYIFQQKMDKPKVSTYVGSGKLDEIAEKIESTGAEVVIFDDDLTPTQVRNVEKKLKVPILDRSGLILQIFSERARTAQARTQVELARMQYMLPRLTRMWTHLSRQRGGTGQRGAGEQEIETDRRIVRDKIALLKQKLEKIEKQNFTRRKNRGAVARVALVGYTNVGKSTLMNLLSKSTVLAENKLFATLDTTVRKMAVQGIPFLLSDTVGFIRKLPHDLIESFKSTLSEVSEADVLLHVVDVSNMHYIEHIKTVKETLAEIGAADKPTIIVFNKIDQLEAFDLEDLKETWMFRENYPAVFISAQNKDNIDELKQILVGYLQNAYKTKYPGLDYYRIG